VFVKLIFFSVFKTSSNQTVIQTYNLTTFKNCSIDDTSYTDTFVYNGGNTVFNQAFTIIVPLTIQGPNYFFSDASDGIQCQHGLAFDINVSRGLGLPPSLNQPPPHRTGSLQVPTQLIRRSLFRPRERGQEIVDLKTGPACK
jgi:hypothetical protein